MPDAPLSPFAGTEPRLDPAFAGAERIALDAMSWIEVVRGWVTGGETLLTRLRAGAPFEQRRRRMYDELVVEPRLTAEYQTLDAVPEPFLLDLVAALSGHYAVPYDGLWINLYRDERDSTGWHGDRATCRQPECLVPVLSLGATRRFLLRPRDGGVSTALTVADGDLVVMGGRCQADWRHCVPKQARPAGARISVNFSSRWQAGRA
ncbi:MAG: alpha-ketoglutarate-dependent dioxygenase AlkB [Actinobacteria bacterium]|nr:alpha-ketoglutarate-dependent dioxygenase AlkB [Actinomycetota bacterium]